MLSEWWFHSKKYIFQDFRPKTAWIEAYDDLKVAPTIAANDVICLINNVPESSIVETKMLNQKF